MKEEYLLNRFHGTVAPDPTEGEYDGHFWRGFGDFGRGSRIGCGCIVCKHGWETARKAYAKVTGAYWEGERHYRQLTLFKL